MAPKTDIAETDQNLLKLLAPVETANVTQPHHRHVATLLAMGYTTQSLEEDFGLPAHLVNRMIRSPQVQACLAEERAKLDKIVQRQFAMLQAFSGDFVDTIHSLAVGAENEKVRLSAAATGLDRIGLSPVKREQIFKVQATLTGADIDEINRQALAAEREGVIDAKFDEIVKPTEECGHEEDEPAVYF